MQTRLNFTGKKRIAKESVRIIMKDDLEENRSFRALIDLSTLGLDEHAKVFVEAYHRMMQSIRFYFGTVSQIVPPDDTSLGLMGLAENVKFRILVINETGDIIASAEGISIDRKKKKTTLLPVELAPLENLVWRLLLDGEEPLLQLNERLEGVKNLAAFDPRFILSVYPSVVREILIYMAVVDDIHFASPQTDWQENWITYTSRIYKKPPEKSFSEAKDEILGWIDEVVLAFSDSRSQDWNNTLMKRWTRARCLIIYSSTKRSYPILCQ